MRADRQVIDPARSTARWTGSRNGRFERAASHNYGGLGLGLFICRQIAEAHGGTIEVDSTLGEGATFVVKLSRRRVAAASD